jgi:hypothetical protein
MLAEGPLVIWIKQPKVSQGMDDLVARVTRHTADIARVLYQDRWFDKVEPASDVRPELGKAVLDSDRHLWRQHAAKLLHQGFARLRPLLDKLRG